ncbi:MAG: hypothetical protein KGM46_10235 [Pseudomonadota bacterium]|nr:hypothetical protein [Xanthomonadaceae bacterium]MDE3211110.1 hypothetical protein [Pseudomonadota bacterium]
MQRIPTDSFLKFCKSLEGQELHTIARRAKFTVKVVDDGLVFTPCSSNKPLSPHKRHYVERVLEDFSKSDGSYKTTNYNGYTVNTSYQLALIDKYTRSVA